MSQLHHSPMVSVTIPSYNHGRYLRQCIESVLAQTYADWELIIVDDCSTDDSLDIARSYHDLRITIHLNDENLGTYATQNRALNLAKGDLTTVLNSDDYWAPTKLEKQVAIMAEYPECPFCYTAGIKVDANGIEQGLSETPAPEHLTPNDQHSPPSEHSRPNAQHSPLSEQSTPNAQHSRPAERPTLNTQHFVDLLPHLFELNRVLASSLMFRKGAVRFDETLKYSGDWKALLDLARQGPAAFANEPLTFYRIHGENTSLKLVGALIEEIRLREAILADDRIWLGRFRGVGEGRTDSEGFQPACNQSPYTLRVTPYETPHHPNPPTHSAQRITPGPLQHPNTQHPIPNTLSPALSLCASALSALYVLVGDMGKARHAARLALRYDPANKTARRRLHASYLPKRLVQRRLWPGLDPAPFEKRSHEIELPPIRFDA